MKRLIKGFLFRTNAAYGRIAAANGKCTPKPACLHIMAVLRATIPSIAVNGFMSFVFVFSFRNSVLGRIFKEIEQAMVS